MNRETLEKLLNEVLAEFGSASGDATDIKELVIGKAAEDPYIQSKLERILDLSTNS